MVLLVFFYKEINRIQSNGKRLYMGLADRLNEQVHDRFPKKKKKPIELNTR